MCDTTLSFARDHLLPLARDHLLPLLTEATSMIRGVPKEVAELKDELESIEKFINDADRIAEAKEESTCKRLKEKIKQLREASFCMEDIIDEYMICEQQLPQDPGCAAGVADLVRTITLRLQIAYKIQSIKSRIREMKDTNGGDHGFQIESPSKEGPSNFVANQNTTIMQNLQDAPLYMDKGDVVGFEAPSVELIAWLIKGRLDRTVISVVGMGGLGKSTLAKKVFDNDKVIKHFDYCAWISVSQSYTIEGLLVDVLQEFHKQERVGPPQNIFQMDRRSLISEVRKYLQKKRYVIVFDDVWNKHFWDDIEFALADNKNGSKIVITTRIMDVAIYCKKSSFVEVHELQPLGEKKSLDLFNKKAFYNLNGCCPENLVNISSQIVIKCKGLPLAIVVIGGLLSYKDRDARQWQKFSENLSLNLIGIKTILGYSYNELPYNLKSCLLYFGIYPEDYKVRTQRLIRQWIAEGFVKEERGETLEETAERYLAELIRRSLVQVSSTTTNGKAKYCRVHDLIRLMILEKFEDLRFCQHISDDSQSILLEGMVRRLSITTGYNYLFTSIKSSHVRSIFLFPNKKLSEYFVKRITEAHKLLKVLDFENATRVNVPPQNLGSLTHLKFLSLRNANVTQIDELLRSISMLQNLETLDLRGTNPHCEMPKETSNLKKLRHLMARDMSLVQMKDGIGGMTSLQTLHFVELDGDGAEELIKELGKLKQLRKLGLVNVRKEHGSTLSSSLSEMPHLEKLYIESEPRGEVIDLRFISPLAKLTLLDLRLNGKLEKFPNWISDLQNLAKLTLIFSQLTNNLMKSLKDLQSLLSLSIGTDGYEGESLYFQEGGFLKLEKLYLQNLNNLSSIIIDKGALHSLKFFELWNIPRLKKVPSGIQHLRKLEVLNIQDLPTEFVQSIAPYGGKEHWMVEHVPRVHVGKAHSTTMLAARLFKARLY